MSAASALKHSTRHRSFAFKEHILEQEYFIPRDPDEPGKIAIGRVIRLSNNKKFVFYRTDCAFELAPAQLAAVNASAKSRGDYLFASRDVVHVTVSAGGNASGGAAKASSAFCYKSGSASQTVMSCLDVVRREWDPQDGDLLPQLIKWAQLGHLLKGDYGIVCATYVARSTTVRRADANQCMIFGSAEVSAKISAVSIKTAASVAWSEVTESTQRKGPISDECIAYQLITFRVSGCRLFGFAGQGKVEDLKRPLGDSQSEEESDEDERTKAMDESDEEEEEELPAEPIVDMIRNDPFH